MGNSASSIIGNVGSVASVAALPLAIFLAYPVTAVEQRNGKYKVTLTISLPNSFTKGKLVHV